MKNGEWRQIKYTYYKKKCALAKVTKMKKTIPRYGKNIEELERSHTASESVNECNFGQLFSNIYYN